MPGRTKTPKQPPVKTIQQCHEALLDIIMTEVFEITDWMDANIKTTSLTTLEKKRVRRNKLVLMANEILDNRQIPAQSKLTIQQ